MAIVADFWILMSSAVQKYIARDIVTSNGILFTYYISASRVTFPFISIISVGSSCIVVMTHLTSSCKLFCLAVTQCSHQKCLQPVRYQPWKWGNSGSDFFRWTW